VIHDDQTPVLIMEVDVRAQALLLVGVAFLAVGCGSSGVTNTAVVSPVSTDAALPLSLAEHDFVEEVQTARPTVDIDARTLVGYGGTACTALGSGGTEAAVEAVRAAGSVDDATARAVVTAAADHLCPGSSASSSTTPAPTTTTSAAAVPRRTATTPRTTVRSAPRVAAVPPATTRTAPTRTTTETTTEQEETTTKKPSGSYRSCAEAKAAGVAPLHAGEPGYSSKLDGDGDGTACEIE
jgi:Excalibur calcium-binding domain/Protein of unknown function (DUF732)